jgi:hypothetical protein
MVSHFSVSIFELHYQVFKNFPQQRARYHLVFEIRATIHSYWINN